MTHSKLKKWKLLNAIDVSPSKWFPIEKRKYQLPNGKIIDDFTVTTLADVAMVIAITPEKKVVVVRQFKPGADQVILEFPAGRKESHHTSMEETAIHELREETGIEVQETQLKFLGVTSGFVTKATEKVYCYLVLDAEINAAQHFDELEEIEVEFYSIEEFDQIIYSQELIASVTLVAWELAKRKFPEIFLKK